MRRYCGAACMEVSHSLRAGPPPDGISIREATPPAGPCRKAMSLPSGDQAGLYSRSGAVGEGPGRAPADGQNIEIVIVLFDAVPGVDHLFAVRRKVPCHLIAWIAGED